MRRLHIFWLLQECLLLRPCSSNSTYADGVSCVISDPSNTLTKKNIFDAYMSKVRLEEEKVIVMREMRQHCTYLRSLAQSIRTEISSVRASGKKRTFISLHLVFWIISICNQPPLQTLVKNTTNAQWKDISRSASVGLAS